MQGITGTWLTSTIRRGVVASVTKPKNQHAIFNPEDRRPRQQPHLRRIDCELLQAASHWSVDGGGLPAGKVADDRRQASTGNENQLSAGETRRTTSGLLRSGRPSMTAGGAFASRMAVIDAAIIGNGSMLDRVRQWPGRCYLLVRPEHDLDPLRLRDLESDLIVVEMLQPPTGAARIFAALHQFDWKLRKAPLDAFLYINGGSRPEELDELLSLGDAGMPDLRLEARDGRTTSLIIGPSVMGHLSLPLFMSVIKNWQVPDILFCELLRKHLIELRS